MIEVFVEGFQLDPGSSFSALLTMAIDDIRDFGAKNSTYSKTIVIPGTKRNNKILGNIFNIQSASDYDPTKPNVGVNFNAAVGARCYIFSSSMQVFKGVFRIMSITIDGAIEYECAVFGELGGFVAKLANKKLEELDFSEFDHEYTLSNIVASWEMNLGFYYPLMDYGGYSTNKKDWDYRTFRPAIWAKSYVDKIFSGVGFKYECELFDTDEFKAKIIPHNQKAIYRQATSYFAGTPQTSPTTSSGTAYTFLFNATLLGNFEMTGSGVKNIGPNITTRITASLGFKWNSAAAATFVILKNGIVIGSTYVGPGGAFGFKSVTLSVDNVSVLTNDVISYQLQWTGSQSFTIDTFSGTTGFEAYGSVQVPAALNEGFSLNGCIPKGILQRDFISSIAKMYNLYIFESADKDKTLLIKPFPDYYLSAKAVDWSQKVDRSRPFVVTPMSELNARYFNFEFKADSDFYNDLYKKRYNENYGSYRYDSEFEFAVDEKKLDVIFSGTPLVGYQGEQKVYSTIFKKSGDTEEQTDSNIRILSAKKLTGLPSWDIKNGGTVLGSYTSYGYAGHYNDPDSPTLDLNFGTPKELFFTLTAGNLDQTSYKRFWDGYMKEITNKDSRLVECTVKLRPKDVYDLDFSKLIWLDGSLFRLNKVIDFNASEDSTCKVQLLKIINLSAITQGGLAGGEDYSYTFLGDGTNTLTDSVFTGRNPVMVVQGFMPLKRVASSPAPGEYSFSGITFTFGANTEPEQLIGIIFN